MSKILVNNQTSDVEVGDTGITVTSNSTYTIPPADYALWAASNDIVTLVGSGQLLVNDGNRDLEIAEGVSLIFGNYGNVNVDSSLTDADRIKVNVTGTLGDGQVRV